MKNGNNNIKLRSTALIASALVAGSSFALSFESFFQDKKDSSLVSMGSSSSYSSLLLDIGNSKVKGKDSLNDVKKSVKKGKNVGLILSSNPSNMADIYNDVEFVKNIMKDTDIKLPVYINIDNIVSNPCLSPKFVVDYVLEACKKMTANRIFVGICGTEKNIDYLLKSDSDNSLSDYDVIITESDSKLNLEESVSSLIIQNEDGEFQMQSDLPSLIESKNLNNPDNFKYDNIVVREEGQTIEDIAHNNQLSVQELADYNGVSLKELKNMKMFRIPTSYLEDFVFDENDECQEIKFAIDLSHHNGNVDWDDISQKCDTAFFKVNEGSLVDSKFASYSKEAMERNFNIGVYCYCRHNGDDSTEMPIEDYRRSITEQCNIFLNLIKSVDVNLPVYYDVENENTGNTISTAEQKVAALDIWYDKMSEAGYTPGFYSNKSIMKKYKAAYDNEYGEGAFEKKFSLWLAGDFYGLDYKESLEYNRAMEIMKQDDLKDEFVYENLDEIDIIQVTEAGCGIGNKGNIDFDFMKSSSSKEARVLTDDEKELLKDKEFDRKSKFNAKCDDFFEKESVINFTLFAAGVDGYFICHIANKIKGKSDNKVKKISK